MPDANAVPQTNSGGDVSPADPRILAAAEAACATDFSPPEGGDTGVYGRLVRLLADLTSPGALTQNPQRTLEHIAGVAWTAHKRRITSPDEEPHVGTLVRRADGMKPFAGWDSAIGCLAYSIHAINIELHSTGGALLTSIYRNIAAWAVRAIVDTQGK